MVGVKTAAFREASELKGCFLPRGDVSHGVHLRQPPNLHSYHSPKRTELHSHMMKPWLMSSTGCVRLNGTRMTSHCRVLHPARKHALGCMFMHVCMHACMHVCIYACMRRMYVSLFAYACMFASVCMLIFCAHMYVYMHVYSVYMHTHIC